MMRKRTKAVCALILAALPLSLVLSINEEEADAQPAKGKPVAPAKPGKPAPPPKTVPDAAPAAEEPPSSSAADAGAHNGDTPMPAPANEAIVDGGKASPLNPQPAELPSNAGLGDAGIPVDYDRLLADIAALRARVAAVADNLYQSRISIALQLDNDKARIARLTVSLDDGVVFTAPQTFAASDMTAVYDHAVAPGRHAVTVDIDRKDSRDEAFRTSQRSRFTVDVPRDNRVEVQVKVIDDSSMGADFPSDKSGKYDLRFRVKAVAKGAGK